MNYRWLVVLLVVVAFGAGAWVLLKPPEMPAPSSAASPLPEEPSAPRRLPDSGPKAVTTAAPVVAPPPGAAPSVQRANLTLYGEYLASRQLRLLYDRLRATADGQTPEGQYLLYEILRRCATVTDRTTTRPMQRTFPKREDFVAGVPLLDPQRERRLAAYDQVEGNRCAGFEGVTVTQAELNKLLADSAAAGDAKARALAVEMELQQRRPGSRSPNDAQLDTLRQVLATRDPGAVMIAGRLFSNTYQDLTVRIGPEGQVAEPRALYNAWQMLACEYGYPCGADNQYILTECALRSHCQATGLQDFLTFYGSSMHDAQLVAQYQQILRNAIATGDWSQVSVARGPRPPGSPRAFFPPR